MKKLGFMNIKQEDILTRDNMKKVLAGSGGFECYTCSGGDCVPYTGSSFSGTTRCEPAGTHCVQSGAACRITG